MIDKSDDDVDPFSLSDDGLAAVADCFSKLEKLSLIWCSNATNAGLKYLAEKCTLLKSLDLQVLLNVNFDRKNLMIDR